MTDITDREAQGNTADSKLMFLAKPGSLRLCLEARSDRDEFRSRVADALWAVMAAEGVDAAMSWQTSDQSRAHVNITLHEPHDQAFSALNDVGGVVDETDTFTALELPPHLNLWLLLDVVAATVSEMYALSIKAKGLQRMCDAISVANFLKNDRVESLLLGMLPSLSESLRTAAGSFLGEEGHALLQALKSLPDDICASLMDPLSIRCILAMPPSMVNLWAVRIHPLKIDVSSEFISFDPHLCHLSGALKCTPKLKVLRIKLRTFNMSHGKAYRDNFCRLEDQPAHMSRITTACETCKKCKCDSRLAVLASCMPFLPELEELALRDCSMDFGSATHFFSLLEPLRALKTLRVTGPNPWLLHCGRLALCEAAATTPLEVLDLSNNDWKIVSMSLQPLTRLATLKQVLLHGSVLDPSPLLQPIITKLEGHTPAMAQE